MIVNHIDAFFNRLLNDHKQIHHRWYCLMELDGRGRCTGRPHFFVEVIS